MANPSCYDEIIDSRDVNTRIEELQTDKELAEEDNEEFPEDDQEELDNLLSLQLQGENYGDWMHGETLIHEDYFTKYAQQLAEDCGDINPHQDQWPYNCIDWEYAAEELKMDYTELDFNGETFLMRA